MESVMNKLRNTVTTVTSTVSQLSVVLPGNPVTREYEIEKQIGSAGPGLFWKIYKAKKKSTRQEAAIFVFEKRLLDKWTKRNRDAMIEILKRGVLQLTKLKHPRVLTIQNPLEESRDSLAFATEPVFSSLANVLGYLDNSGHPVSDTIKNYKLHEIEIKYGLLQVCEGLKFLHNDAKMLHGNVCPEAIVITFNGAWKIFGLDFSLQSANPSDPTPSWSCKAYDTEADAITQQHLDYLAPEYSNASSCSPASDMFSLGMLTYSVFNEGKPLVLSGGSWHSYRQNIATFRNLAESSLFCVPNELRTLEKKLLDFNPEHRPDSHQFLKLEYFHDEGVKTLDYLDSLFQWDNLQKSKFYKGLYQILPKLPHRVRVHRVVPCLAQEFVNPTMVPFVLPNVLKITECSTNEEYVSHILPQLRIVMKLREPVQILLIFMKYMELLLQKTPPDITRSDVLPLIYASLESDSPQVQELCLSIIPSFASLIDYSAMKNSLFPRIRKLCMTTPSLSVRVNCLVCIGKILEHFDKWLVMDFVLPFLTEIPSREPAVIMGIIGIYKLTVSHRKLGVTKEVIATKILPFLFPLSIESGLSICQFTTIMSFIHELINTVEVEQKAKLEEVGAIAKEQQKTETIVQPEFGESSSFDAIFGSISLDSDQSSNSPPNKAPSTNTTNNNDSRSAIMSPFPPAPQKVTTGISADHPSRQQVSNNQPKDLTSTLINSNLQQMNKSFSMEGMTSSIPPPQLNAPPAYGNGHPTFPKMNASMSIPNALQQQQQFPNPSQPMMLSQAHHHQPFTSPAAFQSFAQQQQQPPRMMNSLMNFSKPIQNQDSQVKKLSQRDIDDFLS